MNNFSKKRIGRGNSSRIGNTCGRGQKGQKSRSGWNHKLFFSGGQTKINISIPKYGFRKNKKVYTLNNVNLGLYNINFLLIRYLNICFKTIDINKYLFNLKILNVVNLLIKYYLPINWFTKFNIDKFISCGSYLF